MPQQRNIRRKRFRDCPVEPPMQAVGEPYIIPSLTSRKP
jgi:hypothetical protein